MDASAAAFLAAASPEWFYLPNGQHAERHGPVEWSRLAAELTRANSTWPPRAVVFHPVVAPDGMPVTALLRVLAGYNGGAEHETVGNNDEMVDAEEAFEFMELDMSGAATGVGALFASPIFRSREHPRAPALMELGASDPVVRIAVIVDTCVLLDRLSLVDVLATAVAGGRGVVIIPHAVLAELDGLKKNPSVAVSDAARAAIRSLASWFSRAAAGQQSTVLGESRAESTAAAAAHPTPGGRDPTAGDERLIQTALHVHARGVLVVVVTNDVALRAIAAVEGLTAIAGDGTFPSTSADLIDLATGSGRPPVELGLLPVPTGPPPLPPGNTSAVTHLQPYTAGVSRVTTPPVGERVPFPDAASLDAALSILTECLPLVLEAELRRCVGDVLWADVAASPPPWGLRDCLYIMKKNYSAVLADGGLPRTALAWRDTIDAAAAERGQSRRVDKTRDAAVLDAICLLLAAARDPPSAQAEPPGFRNGALGDAVADGGPAAAVRLGRARIAAIHQRKIMPVGLEEPCCCVLGRIESWVRHPG